MSVAGVGSSVDLYSILQSVNGSSQSADSASTIAAASNPDDDTDGTSATSEHHHHGGHHKGGAGGISSKIESAVTDALQNAPAGSDPNQVIQSAIQDALTGGTDSTSQQTGVSLIDNGSTQSTSSFNQLLQSYGVDPQQFHQDFQSAVQNINQDGSGNVDFSTLFQSFPPGSAVDTVG